jgi:uncharacterized protein YbjT (DUF2867 family)
VMGALRAVGVDGPARPREAVSVNLRPGPHERFELAGPQTLSHKQIVRLVLHSLNRRRPLVHVPAPVVARALRLLEAAADTRAFATWDEAELMEVSMVSARGTADVEHLGVSPQPMEAVLSCALQPA